MPLTPAISQNSESLGELAPLDAPSKPQYNITKYPYDLATSPDNLHYVMFYIDVPVTSKYITQGGSTMSVATASQQNFDYMAAGGGRSNRAVNGTQLLGSTITGAVGSAASGFLSAGGSGAVAGAILGGGKNLATGLLVNHLIDQRPKLKRISECVAIYMPNEIATSYSHNYQEESMTNALGKLGENAAMAAGAVTGIASLFPGIEVGATAAEAGSALAAKSGLVGDQFKDFALKSAGVAKNPQNELIYTGANFREFAFNFRFQARSQAESDAIQNIIYTFRRFAAPEMMSDTQNGRYFIPPAQFDIKFYFKNVENPNIMRVSTCVLKSVTPNYAGAGQFATFYTGAPIDISLKLEFKEADIIYRELIEKYRY